MRDSINEQPAAAGFIRGRQGSHPTSDLKVGLVWFRLGKQEVEGGSLQRLSRSRPQSGVLYKVSFGVRAVVTALTCCSAPLNCPLIHALHDELTNR